MKRLVLLLVLLLCFQVVSAQDAQPERQPLPALPDQTVLDSVIAQTGGVPFTPLGVPAYVMDQLSLFSGKFENVASQLDFNQAVSYFSTDGQLLETVIPLVGNATTALDPDMTAPGLRRPGKIIGAVFRPSRGVFVLVAVFPSGSMRCPECEQPVKLRFYRSTNKYFETTIQRGRFKDRDKNKLVETLDEGALIARRFSCVTVGLEQVCWTPYIPAEERYIARDEEDDETIDPKDAVKSAYTQFKKQYSFKMAPAYGDSMPDLMGVAQRNQCASALAAATDFNALTACSPNVLFTGAKEVTAGQPLGLMVVLQPADLKTYSTVDGSYVGGLPAGSYLVMNATPATNTPGSVGVVMLVNLDMTNHYLLPVMIMQGFGTNSKIVKPVSAIKDGFVWGKGFGY